MEIPGYYYDSEKGRYFKVEKGHTAPPNAAWSSAGVKKRRALDEQAAASARRQQITRNRIMRARVLNEPLTGGFFAREYGVIESDMQAASFTQGLKDRGCASLTGPRLGGRNMAATELGMQVTRMYVGGQDSRTGMCTVHGVVNGSTLHFAYIPRDENNCINQRLLANYRIPQQTQSRPFFEEPLSLISDIQHHEPSNRLILTSRERFTDPASTNLWTISPLINEHDDPESPYWLLPDDQCKDVLMASNDRNDSRYEAHCVAPAPANSPLVCAVGTSRGIVQWEQGLNQTSWLTPPAPLRFNHKQQSPCDLFRDVFAVDFDPSEKNVMRFGGRPGVLFTADIRLPYSAWSHVKLPSTITHLRCLSGGNQVLAAGLRNQLGVYDMRFVRSRRGASNDRARADVDIGDSGGEIGRRGAGHATPHVENNLSGSSRSRSRSRNGKKKGKKAGKETAKAPNFVDEDIVKPVIRFEHYRNAERTDIGFAYDASTGVVAAAHDDVPGTVVLYSVRTGSKLRVLDFQPKEVIQAVQFQTFPGDRTPTLFIGAGTRAGIKAFSFGVDGVGEEG